MEPHSISESEGNSVLSKVIGSVSWHFFEARLGGVSSRELKVCTL